MPTLPMRFLALLAVPLLLFAEGPRLYNQRLDKQAEELKRLAEATANGQFLEAELQNLEQLTKPTLDRIFSSARRLALSRINATLTWSQLGNTLTEIRALNAGPADREQQWKARSAQLQKQIEAARAAAKASVPAPTEPGLAAEILSQAADASEIFDAAEELRKRSILDVSQTDLRVAETLTGLAGQFTGVLEAINKSAATAPTANDALRKMDLALLRAELDHLTALGRIETRRLAAMQDVDGIHGTAQTGFDCMLKGGEPCEGTELFKAGEIAPAESIEATLKRLRAAPATNESRQRLQTALYLLQNYASLCARANTPHRLAEARSAIESRRYRIRRDAIVAQSFEAVLATGAQRIAAHYRGGIRPEVLAQFAQALATAGLIPAVVGK